MKRILFFTLICMTFLIFSASAADAPVVTASLDIEDYCVEISASGLGAYDRVLLVAVPEGGTVNSVLTSGTPAFVRQIETDADGKIDIKVGFSSYAEAVKYAINVVDSAGTYASAPFQYLIESQAIPAKNAINSANAATMYSALTGCDVSLALDMTEYNSLPTEADKKRAAALLHSLRPEGGFEDIAAIHTAFAKAVATVAVPLETSPSDVIIKYSDALGIDKTKLTSLTTDEITAFNQYVKTKTYSSVQELTDGYDEAIFTAKVRCAKTAGEIENLLFTGFSNKLNLDRTYYNLLISPSDVITSIYNIRTSIDGFTDTKTRFENFALDAYNNQPSQGQSQGSSSSGGLPAAAPSVPQSTPAVPTSSYTDLASVQWAADAIELLTKRGVVSGDGNGLFRPNDTVTRAEFLKMLILAFDISVDGKKAHFEDVASDSWYSTYIAAGVECGVVNGISDTSFAPNQTITRQDIAVMCSRALEYTKTVVTPVRYTSTTDFDTVSDYARTSVEKLYQGGIINGYEDGSFKPMQGATRAEVAKIAASLINLREAVN